MFKCLPILTYVIYEWPLVISSHDFRIVFKTHFDGDMSKNAPALVINDSYITFSLYNYTKKMSLRGLWTAA